MCIRAVKSPTYGDPSNGLSGEVRSRGGVPLPSSAKPDQIPGSFLRCDEIGLWHATFSPASEQSKVKILKSVKYINTSIFKAPIEGMM